jgi:hypothetical protein
MKPPSGVPAAGAAFVGRGDTLALALATAAALACALGAGAAYGRWLDAAALAAWAAALALARGAALWLDGGVRLAVVRRPGALPRSVLAAWHRRLRQRAWAASAAFAALASAAGGAEIVAPAVAALLLVVPAATLLTWPRATLALALAERHGRFRAVAAAEAATLGGEFVVPAVLLAAGAPWWLAFALGAVTGRAARSWLLWRACPRRGWAGAAAPRAEVGTGPLQAEARAAQVIVLASLWRDHLHLLIMLPAFGAAWAGRYAFAMLVVMFPLHVVLQTLARIAVPAHRARPESAAADATAGLRRLVRFGLPALALAPLAAAPLGGSFAGGQWQPAVALLPWIALRGWSALATTPLAAAALVQAGPARCARVHLAWAGGDTAAALLGCALLGPPGLAVAAAFSAWWAVPAFAALNSPPPAAPALRAALFPAVPATLAAAALAAAAALHGLRG